MADSLNLKKEMALAARSIRHTKEAAPWLFAEYAVLQSARADLREARKRYDKALKRWNAIGMVPKKK